MGNASGRSGAAPTLMPSGLVQGDRPVATTGLNPKSLKLTKSLKFNLCSLVLL